MAQDRQAPLGHPGQLLLGHRVSFLVGDPKCQPSPSVPERRRFAPVGRHERVRGHDRDPCRGTRPGPAVAADCPAPADSSSPALSGRRRTVSDRNCLPRWCSWLAPRHRGACCRQGELGCGSPATVWRRLDEWARAGVFDALHLEVLDRLVIAGRLDGSRASVDTMSVRAKRGGTTWAQIRSTAASQDPSSTSSPTAKACRCGRADGRQRQRQRGLRGLVDDVPAVRMPSGRRAARLLPTGQRQAQILSRGCCPLR